MSADYMRLSIVFTEDVLSRFTESKDGFSIDLHGMKRAESKRLLNNTISLIRHDFTLTVIHGFHNGTVLRDLVRNDFNNNRIVNIVPDKSNAGRTKLTIVGKEGVAC